MVKPEGCLQRPGLTRACTLQQLQVADYKIAMEDGTVVDDSSESGKPAEFVVGSSRVVAGFHQVDRRRWWTAAEAVGGRCQQLEHATDDYVV